MWWGLKIFSGNDVMVICQIRCRKVIVDVDVMLILMDGLKQLIVFRGVVIVIVVMVVSCVWMGVNFCFISVVMIQFVDRDLRVVVRQIVQVCWFIFRVFNLCLLVRYLGNQFRQKNYIGKFSVCLMLKVQILGLVSILFQLWGLVIVVGLLLFCVVQLIDVVEFVCSGSSYYSVIQYRFVMFRSRKVMCQFMVVLMVVMSGGDIVVLNIVVVVQMLMLVVLCCWGRNKVIMIGVVMKLFVLNRLRKKWFSVSCVVLCVRLLMQFVMDQVFMKNGMVLIGLSWFSNQLEFRLFRVQVIMNVVIIVVQLWLFILSVVCIGCVSRVRIWWLM